MKKATAVKRKPVNSRCKHCVIGIVKDLINQRTVAEDMLAKFQKALLEADRRCEQMQRSAEVKTVQ